MNEILKIVDKIWYTYFIKNQTLCLQERTYCSLLLFSTSNWRMNTRQRTVAFCATSCPHQLQKSGQWSVVRGGQRPRQKCDMTSSLLKLDSGRSVLLRPLQSSSWRSSGIPEWSTASKRTTGRSQSKAGFLGRPRSRTTETSCCGFASGQLFAVEIDACQLVELRWKEAVVVFPSWNLITEFTRSTLAKLLGPSSQPASAGEATPCISPKAGNCSLALIQSNFEDFCTEDRSWPLVA